jgi:hypothetical protein
VDDQWYSLGHNIPLNGFKNIICLFSFCIK